MLCMHILLSGGSCGHCCASSLRLPPPPSGSVRLPRPPTSTSRPLCLCAAALCCCCCFICSASSSLLGPGNATRANTSIFYLTIGIVPPACGVVLSYHLLPTGPTYRYRKWTLLAPKINAIIAFMMTWNQKRGADRE